MDFIPVEGNSSLARDPRTGAIVNINSNEIEQARARKQVMKQRDSEIDNIKSDVAQLKDEVSEIKNLLYKIAEKL